MKMSIRSFESEISAGVRSIPKLLVSTNLKDTKGLVKIYSNRIQFKKTFKRFLAFSNAINRYQ